MKQVMMEIKQKIPIGEWVQNKGKGRGSVGITLESLLGKETENFELPDYKGIELKAKVSKREQSITLFSSVPDSYIFEIKRIHEQYGYPDQEMPEFNVFNASIYGNKKIKINNHYFVLFVDYQKQQVTLQIYDQNHRLIDDYSAWSFDILKEKLERKMKFFALVKADRKYELNCIYFRYTNVTFYQLSSFEKFLKLIEFGQVYVTFRIGVYKSGNKYGQVYDHGTSFNIKEYNIEHLFDKIDLSDQGV